MISRIIIFIVFLLGAWGSITLTGPLHEIHEKHAQESLSGLGRMPPQLLRAMAMDYKGVAADFLFLKTITFVGMRLIERTDLTLEEWRKVNTMLQGVTDLDQRFWDPYLFAEAMFPWQGEMLPEANALLEKAVAGRPNDFQPLYYLGFNAFYFEKNAAKAAPYLRKAAALPGAPDYLQGLAARFSLYSNQTGLGLIFLEDMLRSTPSTSTKSYLEKRLSSLKMIDMLEKAVKKFQEEKHVLPTSFQDMLTAGFIDEIPQDPYGGEFKILPNGRVYTTSNLVEVKQDNLNN